MSGGRVWLATSTICAVCGLVAIYAPRHLGSAVGGLFSGYGYYLAGIQRLSEQRRSRSSSLRQSVSRSRDLNGEYERWLAAQSKSVEKVSPDVHDQLLAMVGGSHDTALRLIDKARVKYPGRCNQWLFERVIADLERDRR